MFRSIRKHAAVFAIAAVVGAVAASAPALASRNGSAATPAIPKIVVHRANTVPVPATATLSGPTLNSFRLPAGAWDIVGKIWFDNKGTIGTNMPCKLRAGTDSDQSEANLESASGADTYTFNFWHRATGPFRVKLTCFPDANDPSQIQGHQLKVTAIKAGSLAQV